jgi:hypothetical protein
MNGFIIQPDGADDVDGGGGGEGGGEDELMLSFVVANTMNDFIDT